MIPSASYSAGFTLRFPRVVAVREDKTWKDVASISEIKKLYQDTKGKMVKGKTIQSSDEGNKSDTDSYKDKKPISRITSETASTSGFSTRRVQTSSKPSTSVLTQCYQLLTDSIEIESSAFSDVEFCLYISSNFFGPSTDFGSKNDFEKAILKRSGKVVQNPGSDTTYVVTDQITAKISNLIEATRKSTGRGKEGGYDIVSTEWLIQCIQANQLLPLRKDQVFASRPSTMLQLDGFRVGVNSDFADLGSSGLSSDNCVYSISPSRLGVELFTQMPVRRLSTNEYIKFFEDDNFSDLILPLYGISIVLYGLTDTSPQLKMMIADLRSLQAIVHGPLTDISALLPERTGTVTHVVAMNERVRSSAIEPVLEEIRNQIGQSGLPIAVTLDWAMGCASHKALLPVSNYHL